MKIEQLRCFLAIERHRRFSKAADSLFITQSALSKQLKSLEEELGMPLFDRSTHVVKLTPAGEKIFLHAQWIVGEHERMCRELRTLSDIFSNKLSLSTPYEMSQFGITDMLIAFEKASPRLVAETHENDHEFMLYNLDNKITDLAIGYQEFFGQDDAHLVYPLLSDPMVLVMHRGHPFAGMASFPLGEAHSQMFCLPREDPYPFRHFLGLCAEAGFSPNLTLSDVRISTIKRYIAHGMRLTVTTRLRASNYFSEPEFRYIPLSGVPPLTLALLSRNERLPSLLQDFILHATQYYCSLTF